jgi:hypothetical protein
LFLSEKLSYIFPLFKKVEQNLSYIKIQFCSTFLKSRKRWKKIETQYFAPLFLKVEKVENEVRNI